MSSLEIPILLGLKALVGHAAVQGDSHAAVAGAAHCSSAVLTNASMHAAANIGASIAATTTPAQEASAAGAGAYALGRMAYDVQKYRKNHGLDSGGKKTAREPSVIYRDKPMSPEEMQFMDKAISKMADGEFRIEDEGTKYRRGVMSLWKGTGLMLQLIEIVTQQLDETYATHDQQQDENGKVKTSLAQSKSCIIEDCACLDFNFSTLGNQLYRFATKKKPGPQNPPYGGCTCGHSSSSHKQLPPFDMKSTTFGVVAGTAVLLYPRLERRDCYKSKKTELWEDINPCIPECGCTDFRLHVKVKEDDDEVEEVDGNCACGHHNLQHGQENFFKSGERIFETCLEVLVEDCYRNQAYVDSDGCKKSSLYDIRRQKVVSSENFCVEYRRNAAGSDKCVCGEGPSIHGERLGVEMEKRARMPFDDED